MFKTKYDFDQNIDNYVEYLKEYISNHTKKEIYERKHDPKGYTKLNNNFMAVFLGSLDDTRTVEVLEYLESQNKFDPFQLVQIDTVADVILNDSHFQEGYELTKKFTQDAVDSQTPKINLTETLKLLNKARKKAKADETLREFFSKPFLRSVTKNTKIFEFDMFRSIHSISNSRKEYTIKSPLTKEIVTDFVKELEGYEIFNNSHFVDYPELYHFVNKIIVGIKEFDIPTIENLKYIFEINPFYRETLDRTDIKVLKEIFFKKVVPKEWDALLSQLNEENIILLQRSKSLKIVGLTINEKKEDKSIFDKLEASGKIRKDYRDTYSFRGYNLFEMMGVEIINEKQPYLKLHYRDINSTKRMLDEMGMWEDFETNIATKIKNRFHSLREHLGVLLELSNISYISYDRGYFKIDFELPKEEEFSEGVK